ncbi:MAG TPA: hypothetical protein VGD57_03475 [Candidatus Dormibacteraeota bacterium]
MNPRPEDVEALASAIDRIVFPDSRSRGRAVEASAEAAGIVSYLNDSFPRMSVAAARRARLERRIASALGLPRPTPEVGLGRLEVELNRRLGNLDLRWGPVVGGTALLLLGVLGFAVWRQRGGIKPATAALR